MNEVIYQLKTIMEDLGFVQSSLIHTMELMKSSEDFEDFVKERHLEEKLTQSRQFALGASMRLEMARQAVEAAQAENAALRVRVARLEETGKIMHNALKQTDQAFRRGDFNHGAYAMTAHNRIVKVLEAVEALEAGGENK